MNLQDLKDMSNTISDFCKYLEINGIELVDTTKSYNRNCVPLSLESTKELHQHFLDTVILKELAKDMTPEALKKYNLQHLTKKD